MKQHKLDSIPYQIDKTLDFAKKYNIRVAPTVCMMSDEQIVYKGRISDLFNILGMWKINEAHRDFYNFLKKCTAVDKDTAEARESIDRMLF